MKKRIPLENENLEYYATDSGYIYNSSGRRLKLEVSNTGYLRVVLRDRKHYSVHRLIGKTFIPNPENLPEINHLDGDRRNNNKKNLAWTTRSQNQKHAYDNGLQVSKKGEDTNLSKLKETEVLEIRKLYSTGDYSYTKLGKLFNTCRVNVFKIVKRETWKHV